jgi:hypothetical protein
MTVRRLLLAALLAAAAPCLFAGFTAEVSGTIQVRNEPLPEGITITAKPDPWWGMNSQLEVDTRRELGAHLPEFTTTGSATPDENGKFTIRIRVTPAPGQQLQTVRNAERNRDLQRAHIILHVAADSYSRYRQRILIVEDTATNPANIWLNRAPIVAGRIVRLSDHQPLAGVALRLVSARTQGPALPGPIEWTVETAEDGTFRFDDRDGPWGSVVLSILDPEWAFPSISSAWRPFNLRVGENDLGTLMVVPAGELRLRVRSQKTGEAPKVHYTVTLQRFHGAAHRAAVSVEGADATGEVRVRSLPPGDYGIRLIIPGYFEHHMSNLSVAAGEVKDLGEILAITMINQQFEIVTHDGTIPQRGRLRGTLVEAPALPPNKRETVSGTTGGSSTMLAGMYPGTWRIDFTSSDHPPVSITVTLPTTETPRIVIPEGVTVEVLPDPDNDTPQPDRVLWIAIAVAGTPGEEWLRAHSGSRMDRDAVREHAGLVVAERHSPPASVLLAPGTYVLRAGLIGGMSHQPFEIRAGEPLRILLRPVPARLEVVLTRDGRPLSDQRLFLHIVQHHGSRDVQELRTDRAGLAVYESRFGGTVHALLEAEHQWVTAARDPHRASRYALLSERSFKVPAALTTRVEIDIAVPIAASLTVNVNAGQGSSVRSGSLQPTVELHSYQNRVNDEHRAVVQDNRMIFPALDIGRYRLVYQVAGPDNQLRTLIRDVELTARIEKSIDERVALTDLNINVRVPRGVETERIWVTLYPVKMDDRFSFRAEQVRGGRFVARNVPHGTYTVRAAAPRGDGGRVQLAGSEIIKVTSGTTATLVLHEDTGDLQVSLAGVRPALLPRTVNTVSHVTLLDADGNVVAPHDIRSAMRQGAPSHVVSGVPAGDYTVVVNVTGVAEWRGEATVTAGETTLVRARSNPAAMVRLVLDASHAEALLGGAYRAVLEDSEGNAVSTTAPRGEDRFVVSRSDGRLELLITNIDDRSTRLVFQLDGYRTLTFDLRPQPGVVDEREFAPEAE